MNLICQSITYHNCPVELRETLALDEPARQEFLKKFSAELGIYEALVLSTCNRTEFYLHVQKYFDAESAVEKIIASFLPGAVDTWRKYRLTYAGIDVVKHLFSVASGLDSQMLGEDQIINQLKAAYSLAIEAGMSKFLFHRLLHRAFNASKAVRTQTDIACGAVSISLAAVELARSRLDLPASHVLLAGAGENTALAARYLIKAGVTRLTIASRTLESARSLAALLKTGRCITLEKIPQMLSEVDMVICSTASSEPVITPANCAYIISQRQKPLLIIDIAVPRDVAPAVAVLPSVTLYNIDDLNEHIEKNKRTRALQIPKANAVILARAENFAQWLDSLDAAEVVARLNQKFADYARRHARRYASDFRKSDAEKLEKFAASLVKKLLHGPVTYLKESAASPGAPDTIEALDLVGRMFLDDDLWANHKSKKKE